jgi:uncharacterized repeat protein (TIGR01451 family)
MNGQIYERTRDRVFPLPASSVSRKFNLTGKVACLTKKKLGLWLIHTSKNLPLALLILLSLASVPAYSRSPQQLAIVPGGLRADATFQNIGVIWEVSGDDNLNSHMTLEFRPQGSAVWQPGAFAMRAYPTILVDGAPLGLDYWAASAMFLQAGQAYELRLTISDPDGGGDVRTITTATRNPLAIDPAGQQRYVIPGNGGGDGGPGNPFQGLQAAADAAQPGDVFHVAAGTYAPFQLLTSGAPGHPISFLADSPAAVIDGGDTDRGVVTLGEYDQNLSYVILQGFTIQNGLWGVDAQRTQDIAILNNLIQDVDFGVLNRRDGGLEANQTVCDNTILGRVAWPGTGIPEQRGIDLRGTGNVVCYNRVRNFGDCVSVQPFTGPSYGNDVFGNDAAYCVDDGIEIDYNQANVRVWRNRVMDARMGVSVQPIRGGPAYILRNEFFNLESNPIKLHNQTTGLFIAHNTGVKLGDGQGDDGAMWRNAVFRDNLFLGTSYAFEFTTVPDEGFRDFDYDAWGTTRADGSPSDPYFKWNNVRYSRLADLQTLGVELHGVAASFSDLVNAALPASWDQDVPPGNRDLRLAANAPEIDAGVPLPNLDDAFTLSGTPDLGAFEYGLPQPEYGPRPQAPDLSGSAKQASAAALSDGEVVTYTVTILNRGAALSAPAVLTDTLPASLDYLPGSLSASSGSVDESRAPQLSWTGGLGAGESVTVSYAARVATSLPKVLTNTAEVSAGAAGTIRRSASLIVNGQQLFLPLLR